jgi:hypothetical protein
MAASSDRKPTPDFFEDVNDPVQAAVSKPPKQKEKSNIKKEISTDTQKHRSIEAVKKKKKVGYYFKPSNVERLDNIFLEIQLKKLWKGKISEFMEAILEFGLDDLESRDSKIIKRLKNS